MYVRLKNRDTNFKSGMYPSYRRTRKNLSIYYSSYEARGCGKNGNI